MVKYAFIIVFFISGLSGIRNIRAQSFVSIKNDDPVLAMLDSLQELKYFECNITNSDSCLYNYAGYNPGVTPYYDDLVYEARLAKLDEKTPFDLVYNSVVKQYIDLYSLRKRILVCRLLGLSDVYFPLFEEKLAKYNLPVELKYLAIVESALNPIAVSKSGACGLWQFMYPTGKMFGLEVNSYVDDRKDPIKATEAACKYFTYLYSMFGDWQLVLAAYNCGPGVVNKAIRRSGGIKNYWQLRAFLPSETQAYVPAFIAVNYVMNHTREHNLLPIPAKRNLIYTDTVKVNQNVSFYAVSLYTGVSVEDLQFLNPSYRQKRVPAFGDFNTLCLPVSKIGDFLSNQTSIYLWKTSSELYQDSLTKGLVSFSTNKKIHKVKKGESLAGIARQYNCSIDEIKKWNRLKKNQVHTGAKIIVYQQVRNNNSNIDITNSKTDNDSIKSSAEASVQNVEESASAEEKSADKMVKTQIHIVQKGDTLWNIVNRYKMSSIDELLKLNGISKGQTLHPGQKLKVIKGG